ncbi:MAG: DUF2306 domain-containing protein [Rhodospirillales bacterium]|nr:DUF2306 domain-containing protein [Rhodospirillales bacterium]
MLNPLTGASPVIQIHVYAASLAFLLGLAQIALPKGTGLHRALGWVWIVLMTAVAFSSFWIHEIRLWGPWSVIHLLSVATLVALAAAVWHARRHRIQAHRLAMLLLFFGALVIAGIFTLFPGRILHRVLF